LGAQPLGQQDRTAAAGSGRVKGSRSGPDKEGDEVGKQPEPCFGIPKPHRRVHPETLTARFGSFEYTKTGAARFDLSDPYNLAVSLSWPRFFAALVLLDLAINTVFALLYWLVPGSVANAGPGFAPVFFFSVETLATVGYGVMAPASLYGHIVSSIEILCGLIFTALVTGLIFVRFSRPRAKIRFADGAVIARHARGRALMVRIGNGKLTLLSDAKARVMILFVERTAEGQMLRRPEDLVLERDQLPLFALSWTLTHVIDESSPLYGVTTEALVASDLRLLVFIEARDHALGAMVYSMRDYPTERILYGMRYQDIISIDQAGRTNVDLTRISLVEQDDEPLADPLDDGQSVVA
jgi:inward rectifier potassium channel